MTKQQVLATHIRKLRQLVLFSVPSWVLLYPCVQSSIVFFLNDHLYQLSLRDAQQGASFPDVLRKEAEALATKEGFRCVVDTDPKTGKSDHREPLLVVLERVDSNASGRLLSAQHTAYLDALSLVERLDLPFLRRGTAIDREYSRLYLEHENFVDHKLEPFCNAQAERTRFEEPPLPPIKAYGEARQILLRGASRMERALGRYAEVRPWLRAFFYTWIAYSIAGLVCAVLILRRIRRMRANLKLNTSEPSTRPPATS